MTAGSLPMRIGGAALEVLLAVGIVLGAKSCTSRNRLAEHAAQADALAQSGTSNLAKESVYADQSTGFKAQVAQDDAKAPARDAEVSRRRAAVALARKPAPEPAPAPGEPEPALPPVDWAAVAAHQELLIQSLDAQHQDDLVRIADRDKLVASQALQIASAVSAAKDFQAQAVQEHAARVAAEGLAKSQLNLGRLEGGTAVVVAGLILKAVL